MIQKKIEMIIEFDDGLSDNDTVSYLWRYLTKASDWHGGCIAETNYIKLKSYKVVE